LTQSEKLQQIVNEEEEKKISPMITSLSKAVCAEAKVFCTTYGNDPTEFFDWEILGNQENHIDKVFMPPTSSNVVNSSFVFDAPFMQNFFDHIFPSVEGHAAIIDKYLADPRATYYKTIKSHKI
jgi:hypothetical protein